MESRLRLSTVLNRATQLSHGSRKQRKQWLGPLGQSGNKIGF
jgi:hypothetical protein